MKTLIASNLILVILLLVALQHIIELHEDVKAFQASDALSSAEFQLKLIESKQDALIKRNKELQ